MKWNIDHSNLPVYVRVTVEGQPAVEDNRAMWDEILASEHWKPGTSILYDNSRLDALGTTATRITEESVRYFIEREAEIGPTCIAVYRGTRDIPTYSRQFQYAIRLRGSSVIIRNFADEDAAVEWLSILAIKFGPESEQSSTAVGDG